MLNKGIAFPKPENNLYFLFSIYKNCRKKLIDENSIEK